MSEIDVEKRCIYQNAYNGEIWFAAVFWFIQPTVAKSCVSSKKWDISMELDTHIAGTLYTLVF